jgi:hypothetical protein
MCPTTRTVPRRRNGRMIVVADTGAIRYLTVIGAIVVLYAL